MSHDSGPAKNARIKALPFYTLIYFWLLLLGLSGIVIFNLPDSRRGTRYIFLKCFLSVNSRYPIISFLLLCTRQN